MGEYPQCFACKQLLDSANEHRPLPLQPFEVSIGSYDTRMQSLRNHAYLVNG